MVSPGNQGLVEERGEGVSWGGEWCEHRLRFECVAVVKRNGLVIATKRMGGR